MSEITITVKNTKRLLTKGKFCDKNIVVTAEGGDAFWDVYQQNGERKEYSYAFGGEGWSDAIFQPKYSIAPTRAVHMFSGSHITDLVKALLDAGVTLDTSKLPGEYLMQNNSYTQTMPELNCTGRRNVDYFLYGCSALRSIEKVVLKDDGSQKFNTYSFYQLPALEEIRFAGTIGNSLEIKDSPVLSDASVQSIIDHLKDLTGATAQTLTLHATVGANMTDEQKAAITAKNWTLVY